MFILPKERARGCMIAAAYGDMLGAAVEFMTLGQIVKRYGTSGITVPQPAFGFATPIITDDTQMAIATGRALARLSPKDRRNLQKVRTAISGLVPDPAGSATTAGARFDLSFRSSWRPDGKRGATD